MECTSEEVILKNLKVNLQTEVGGHVLANMEVNKFDQYLTGHFLIELRTNILGQSRIQRYSVEVKMPLNSWQHFKQDVMPEWFKKRYPVKEKIIEREITFDHMALLPDFKHIKDQRTVMHTPFPPYGGVYKIN